MVQTIEKITDAAIELRWIQCKFDVGCWLRYVVVSLVGFQSTSCLSFDFFIIDYMNFISVYAIVFRTHSYTLFIYRIIGVNFTWISRMPIRASMGSYTMLPGVVVGETAALVLRFK